MCNNSLACGGKAGWVWIVALVAASARADCPAQWLSTPGQGLPGLSGRVFSTAVYDDGTGPALYAGGAFRIAGTAFAVRIAKWDGSQWRPLGSGITGNDYPRVCALAVYNGELIAGGEFSSAGDGPASHLAR